MSGRRRRSESLWDRKEDSVPQSVISEKIPSKRSNSEGNDVLMSGDYENMPTDNDRHRMKTDSAFDEWENQYSSRPSDDSYNLPYRARNRGVRNMSKDRDRSRSRSPHRTKGRDRDRGQGRARSPFRGGASRLDNDYSSGLRFEDDRDFSDNPRSKGSDGYRKDNARNRSGYDDQDHRWQSNQSVKTACRFFIMGNCNRSNCKFSHDLPKSEGYENRSHDNIHGHNSGNDNPWIEDNSGFSDFPNSNPNFDDKKKSWNGPSWNDLELGGFDELDIANNQFPSTLNGNEVNLQSNGSVQGIFPHLDLQNQTDIQNKEDKKLLETSKNDIANTDQQPQKVILTTALNLLHSLPNPVDSTVVNEPVEISEVKVNENNLEKTETQGKVEEGNIGNDEKAMRQFKIALVEFVKEILKPTWKEGKMSREDYKTIVKKVAEKVTSTIQGIQIPRTQEKIDQYLAFSKSKITKLVEAYVGRFQKA